ncbi:MAG: GGDEF domain-containing protein [Clostridia bacterium]|jgi:diguanylate cyclase (GGDEF)-like protein|nr:GGDEF domain-containing protein [Clostridia bacterium]
MDAGLLFYRIKQYGGLIKDDFDDGTNTSIIIYLNEDDIIYKVCNQSVVDKKGENMGSYVEMMEITQLIKIMEDIERNAQTDWLTGLPNRQAFEEKCIALDNRENPPLSFIVGDINGLKYVNDHMGHHQGDLLIKAISKVLQNSCPQDGVTARVGGDEFMMVIPNFSELDTDLLVKKISEKVKAEENGSFYEASIALGSATKVHSEQIIEELLKKADIRMYSKKQYDRRRQLHRSKTYQ